MGVGVGLIAQKGRDWETVVDNNTSSKKILTEGMYPRIRVDGQYPRSRFNIYLQKLGGGVVYPIAYPIINFFRGCFRKCGYYVVTFDGTIRSSEVPVSCRSPTW